MKEEPNKRTIRGVIHLLKMKGYKVYDAPFQLNIVSIRSNTTKPNSFDDKMFVFWKDDKNDWNGKFFTITTDPGTYWLKNPMNPQGTAILKEGQYEDAYQIGLHQGKYEALVQRKPVTVIRDYDRNAILDFNNGKESTGLYGINIHRANKTGTTKTIDKNSAGCQVFENAEDFATFMNLAKKHSQANGNKFTYTLIDERAFARTIKRRTTYVILALLALGAMWTGYRAYKNKSLMPKITK